jgi:hypothetical protein
MLMPRVSATSENQNVNVVQNVAFNVRGMTNSAFSFTKNSLRRKKRSQKIRRKARRPAFRIMISQIRRKRRILTQRLRQYIAIGQGHWFFIAQHSIVARRTEINFSHCIWTPTSLLISLERLISTLGMVSFPALRHFQISLQCLKEPLQPRPVLF